MWGWIVGSWHSHIVIKNITQISTIFVLTIQKVVVIIFIRTDVCVYKGVYGMKDKREELIEKLNKLLKELTTNQIEYIYHLGAKLFGKAVD